MDTALGEATSPPPGTWLAEVSDSTRHGAVTAAGYELRFAPWNQVWTDSGLEFHHEQYASLFRFPLAVVEYTNTHVHGGHETIRGWRDGKPGLIGGDIDRESLDAALVDARRVLEFLITKGVSTESFVFFFSGSKGFSAHLLAEVFGPALGEVLAARHPAHEESVLLALKALFNGVPFDASSRQTIRLFRLPNSVNKRSGLFKVPLAPGELLAWDIPKIKEIARAPRHDVRITPSAKPDPALARLLEPLAAAHNEAARLAPAAPRRAAPGNDGLITRNRPHSKSIQANQPPHHTEEEAREVMGSLEPLVNPLSPACRKRLVECWLSRGFCGSDSSRWDYHFALELLRLGWDDRRAEIALWLRPRGKARRRADAHGVQAGSEYAAATVAAARRQLESTRSSRPQALVMSAEPRTVPSWLKYMPLWFNGRTGIGNSPKNIYLFHVDTAILKEGFDPREGCWSPEYFLARTSILSPGIAIARSAGTVARAHDLLRACRLLRLVRRGSRRTGDATTWRVRIPAKGEREALRRAGVAAAKVLRASPGITRRVRAAMFRAARMAVAGLGPADGNANGGSGSSQ